MLELPKPYVPRPSSIKTSDPSLFQTFPLFISNMRQSPQETRNYNSGVLDIQQEESVPKSNGGVKYSAMKIQIMVSLDQYYDLPSLQNIPLDYFQYI